MTDPNAELLSLLQPVLRTVAELSPRDADDEATAQRLRQALQDRLPFEDATIQEIGRAITTGIEAGTLCTRGEPDARFSRVAKPSDATHGLSVDLVSLRGPARRPPHPAGEVTLAFATDDPATGRFDGHPPGWVVMAAGSTHTPTVAGARMHLLYFLPDGAVEWNPDAPAS